jgi:hypothetical protein
MDKGYSGEEMTAWQREADAFGDIASDSPAIQNVMHRVKDQTQSTARADIYRNIEQQKLQREAMRAAYASGNKAAATQTAYGMSEAQSDSFQRVNAIAREDSDRAMQSYAQLLQQRQRIQFSAQEARAAYIMGNQKIALSALDNARRAEVASKGIAMQEAQAKADAGVKMQTALVSAGSTLLASGGDWFKSPQTSPPVQNMQVISGEPIQLQQETGFLAQQRRLV